MRWRYPHAALFGGALLLSVAPARAVDVENYGFEAAAQEITQLYWLAETANACGWASAGDTSRFKDFSVRFLSAHLSERHRNALVHLVTAEGYEDNVRTIAREGAQHNCDSNRWRIGWVAYKQAADENEAQY